jgi:hypothetical protein
MSVEFRDPPPIAALRAAGGRVERQDGNRVELRVQGNLQPLLEILAEHSVLHLVFPEPSLEEAFNNFYRNRDPEATLPGEGGSPEVQP